MRVLEIILFSCLTLVLTSCGNRHDVTASMGEALLFEAETLIETREFLESQSRIEAALTKLDSVLEAEPKNIDFLLLRARAHILLFRAKNVLVLEKAPILPKSLVRIPHPSKYDAFQEIIPQAERDLKAALNQRSHLSKVQETSARGMLAGLYRLHIDSAKKADTQYDKAIIVAKSYLSDLKNENRKIGSNNFTLAKVKGWVHELLYARIETNLLLNNWNKALKLLEETQGGTDLKYFSIQFTLLENKIADLQNRITENRKYAKNTREGKLLQLIKKKKSRRIGNTPLGDGSILQHELFQFQERLTDTKNNLIYRMICYYNLNEEAHLEEVRKTLQTYYPAKQSEVFKALKNPSSLD